MQFVARPRPRCAVIPTKSASLSRRGRGLRGTMVFLLFDQMHASLIPGGTPAGNAAVWWTCSCSFGLGQSLVVEDVGHAASGLDALLPRHCIAVRTDFTGLRSGKNQEHHVGHRARVDETVQFPADVSSTGDEQEEFLLK